MAAVAASSSSQTMTSTDFMHYWPLYQASMEGDWETAKRFLDSNPNAITAPIEEGGNTALGIAALGFGQADFIEKIVQLMPPEALAIQDMSGYTALHNIATTGDTKAAQILVNKNPSLTQIRNGSQQTPLLRAAVFGHKELVVYLCSQTTDDQEPSPFRGVECGYLFSAIIQDEFYDVALHLIGLYPEMAITKDYVGNFPLSTLAPQAVPETPNVIFANALKQLVPRIKKLYDTKIKRKQYLKLVADICDQVALLRDLPKLLEVLYGTILVAAKFGNLDLIKLILKINPREMWSTNNLNEGLLHIAIKYRQRNVFIYLRDEFKDQLVHHVSQGDETILHRAATLAQPSELKAVSGAALQVQRELQWYKEVEKIIQPLFMDWRNVKGENAREMFTKQHENLVKEGEKWMKDMASSSMVVATLIATVVFAAAFTVPGGNVEDKGIPIFLHTRSYMVFAVSNALAFFSSLTSVLMFLSILTARYAEEDFLRSLPQKLIIGLAMLFFAIATMTIAFSATYFIMLGHKLAWLSILIALLTCFPVTLFAFLQFPLFLEMVHSTYRSTL